MGSDCKNGNHIIGAKYTDKSPVNLHDYIENGGKHPGCLFKFCPDCGVRLFVDDLADKHENTSYYLENKVLMS